MNLRPASEYKASSVEELLLPVTVCPLGNHLGGGGRQQTDLEHNNTSAGSWGWPEGNCMWCGVVVVVVVFFYKAVVKAGDEGYCAKG